MFLQIMWNFFLPVLLCTLPFVFILVLNGWVDRRTSWPREYHRKLGHVLSGLVIITSTYILTYHQLLVFAFILILVALSTYLFHLASIHGVERKTIGTFLFPLAFLICLLLFAERQIELVRYGIWILTIPDALAALIGSQWGRQIPRWNKSLLGSTVFAFSLFVVTFIFTHSLILSLLVVVVLTPTEFVAQWGTDNLLLPLLGSSLLYLLI